MYKCYGIPKAIQSTGVLDEMLQRAAQARKIRRFCATNDLRLIGNNVLTSDSSHDLLTAYNLWEMGWIDCVVISSREVYLVEMDNRSKEMLSILAEKNALIVLDECKFV